MTWPGLNLELGLLSVSVGIVSVTLRQCKTNLINSFTPRTLQSHIRQCIEIERASTDSLKNALMTTYGIKRRSKLLDFPGYDLIQQTPQDIMHIMLEGVVQQEIKCALKHIILSGHIDLDSINSVIQGFPYSNRDIKDKPCPISVSTMASDDNKLKQLSSGIW